VCLSNVTILRPGTGYHVPIVSYRATGSPRSRFWCRRDLLESPESTSPRQGRLTAQRSVRYIERSRCHVLLILTAGVAIAHVCRGRDNVTRVTCNSLHYYLSFSFLPAMTRRPSSPVASILNVLNRIFGHCSCSPFSLSSPGMSHPVCPLHVRRASRFFGEI